MTNRIINNRAHVLELKGVSGAVGQRIATALELDAAINGAIYRHDGRGGRGTIPNPPPTRNDSERRQWVMNDEGLYSWARSEGVRV